MACLIARASSTLRAGAAIAVLAAAPVSASGAFGQTMTNPNPQANAPQRPPARARPAVRTTTCSAYGAGFVNVPGTDACVKIGGWVTVEGSARR